MKKKIFAFIVLFLIGIYAWWAIPTVNAIQLVTNVSGAGASEGYAYRTSGNKALWTPGPDSILTTLGDMLYRDSDTTLPKRLPIGSVGKMLVSDGNRPLYDTGTWVLPNQSRAAATATGDVSYTGCPFKPNAILVIAWDNFSTTGGSVCFAENNASTGTGSTWASGADANSKIIYSALVADKQTAVVSSWDSTGITFTWTKEASGNACNFSIIFGLASKIFIPENSAAIGKSFP